MALSLVADEVNLFAEPKQVYNVAASREEIVPPTHFAPTYPGSTIFHIGKSDTSFTSTKFHLRTVLKVLKKNAETNQLVDIVAADNVALIPYRWVYLHTHTHT